MLAALFLLTNFYGRWPQTPSTSVRRASTLMSPHLKHDLTYLIHKILTFEKDPRKHPANPAK